MKRIIASGLLLSCILISSCGRFDSAPTSEETGSIETAFVIPSYTRNRETSATTFEEYSIEYDIDQTYLNVSFEDVYSYCEELSGVDFDDWVQNESDNNTVLTLNRDGIEIMYIHDYSAFLDLNTTPDDVTGYSDYYPEEYEYHITRRLMINGVYFDEFEDDHWALVDFSKIIDAAEDKDSVMEETEFAEGYCYSLVESSTNTMFYANYVSGNCVMSYSYSYNHADCESYDFYLDICETLGLPACSEMTEEILS